jgi:hypothetical protein
LRQWCHRQNPVRSGSSSHNRSRCCCSPDRWNSWPNNRSSPFQPGCPRILRCRSQSRCCSYRQAPSFRHRRHR